MRQMLVLAFLKSTRLRVRNMSVNILNLYTPKLEPRLILAAELHKKKREKTKVKLWYYIGHSWWTKHDRRRALLSPRRLEGKPKRRRSPETGHLVTHAHMAGRALPKLEAARRHTPFGYHTHFARSSVASGEPLSAREPTRCKNRHSAGVVLIQGGDVPSSTGPSGRVQLSRRPYLGSTCVTVAACRPGGGRAGSLSSWKNLYEK